MTQCSPRLTNPLPDCSNYLQFCHIHFLILRINTSLPRPSPFTAPLETNTSLLQRFTAESSRELMSLITLRKLNNKRQVVMFLLLFKLSSQLPFLSFSFLSISLSLSSLCSLSQSSLFSLSLFPLPSKKILHKILLRLDKMI